jgi:hypothetical protein
MYAWEVLPTSGRCEGRLTTGQKTERQTGRREYEYDFMYVVYDTGDQKVCTFGLHYVLYAQFEFHQLD